jgi:hypothetical protein
MGRHRSIKLDNANHSQSGTHPKRLAYRSHAKTTSSIVIKETLAIEAPAVLENLIRIAKSNSSAPAVVAAAKQVLALAGYVGPSPARLVDDGGKQLVEMTPDELRATIDKHDASIEEMERLLAEQATPVNAPNEGEEAGEGADFLE